MVRVMDESITVSTAQLVLYRLDTQQAMLEEIREHVRKTNGRVTTLELERARDQGAAEQRGRSRNWTQWAINTLIAILAVLLTCGAVATGIIAL